MSAVLEWDDDTDGWSEDRWDRALAKMHAGEAGVRLFFSGGPWDGAQGRLPHVDVIVYVISAAGAQDRYDAAPMGWDPEVLPHEWVRGVYRFDRDAECMRWIA